jgi:nitroreductase
MRRAYVGAMLTADPFFTVEARHSVREFAREVEPGELEQILMAANRAPSGGNLQTYQIVLVRAPERRQALARAATGRRSRCPTRSLPIDRRMPGQGRTDLARWTAGVG